MKLAPTGLGAEPKKVALLVGIIVVGGIVVWIQNRSDTPVSANVAPPPPIETQPLKPLPQKQATAQQQAETAARGEDAGGSDPGNVMRRGPLGASSNDTFLPTLKQKEGVDLSKVDPRIRLDLLAKVRAVPLEGGASSLFDFSKPPAPPTPPVPPIVPVPPPPKPEPAKVISQNKGPVPTPPPPPVPFKYYGYAGNSEDGQLQGLFTEGDALTGNIYPKREGDIIKDRWKIVHIGLKSATVEDTVTHNQQKLTLIEEPQQ